VIRSEARKRPALTAGFSILNDVVLNQVLVSFDINERTRRVIEGVQAEGTCWCGGTVWHGRTAMRISRSSWATTDDDVERSLASIMSVARQSQLTSRFSPLLSQWLTPPRAVPGPCASMQSLITMIAMLSKAGTAMSSITIRNLEEAVKRKLRVRAARHGRSMEEEARHILRTALAEKASRPTNLFDSIRRRIEPLGGVDLEIPRREPLREPPRFEK